MVIPQKVETLLLFKKSQKSLSTASTITNIFPLAKQISNVSSLKLQNYLKQI